MTKTIRLKFRLQAIILATQFAQELKLPVGNLWECGIVRQLQRDLTHGLNDRFAVENWWRFRLGLRPPASSRQPLLARQDKPEVQA